MKKFFSIFYLGGLYAYSFKEPSIINLIYFAMFGIFVFYTIISCITLIVHNKNPSFIDKELQDEVSKILEDTQKQPFLAKIYKIILSIYYAFFIASLLLVPLFNLNAFMAFAFIVHVIFIFSTSYYYIIIKDKIYKIKIDFTEKHKEELEFINQHNESEKNENKK